MISLPPQLTLDDLIDVDINNTLQSNLGCCANEEWCRTSGFTWPSNGEFIWAGTGDSCRACFMVPGGECPTGMSMTGRRPTVKRISYGADPLTCCTNTNANKTIVGNYTCDPQYRGPNAPGCLSVGIQQRCSGIDAFDQICTDWGANDPAAHIALNIAKSTYCNNIINYNNDDRCKSWCTQEGRGMCDTSTLDYCYRNENFNDPICACINSAIQNPQCNMVLEGEDVSDSTCQNTGYWTSQMSAIIRDGACPSVYNCKQDFPIAGVDNIVRRNNMIQICGGDASTGADVGNQNTDLTNAIISGVSNIWLLFFIIIIILAVLFKKSKTDKSFSITKWLSQSI